MLYAPARPSKLAPPRSARTMLSARGAEENGKIARRTIGHDRVGQVIAIEVPDRKRRRVAPHRNAPSRAEGSVAIAE